jgi:transposase
VKAQRDLNIFVKAGPWPPVLICSALLAGLVVILGAPSPIRPIAALWFLAVCPGMAIVGLFHFDNRPIQLTLAIASSLAVDALVAIVGLYVGWWSPQGFLAVLIGLTIAGAAAQVASSMGWPRALGRGPRRRLRLRRRTSTQLIQPGAPVEPPTEPSWRPDAPPAVRRRRYPSDLTDDEWRVVSPLLPADKTADDYDARVVCDAIFYVLRTGAGWRQLPRGFPPQGTVRRYLRSLRRNGSWDAIVAALEAINHSTRQRPDDSTASQHGEPERKTTPNRLRTERRSQRRRSRRRR